MSTELPFAGLCDAQACGLSGTGDAGLRPLQPQAPSSGPEPSEGSRLPGLNRAHCPVSLAARGSGAPGGLGSQLLPPQSGPPESILRQGFGCMWFYLGDSRKHVGKGAGWAGL